MLDNPKPVGNQGETIWAWVTRTPQGDISIVGAMIPGLGNTPLIGRSEKAVRDTRRLAKVHAKMTGQRVWLRRWDNCTDLEDA